MNKLLAATFASALTAGLALSANAAPNADKEKCYGISKAGKNDCSSASHSCAGMSKADNLSEDWKFVAKGECAKDGGKLAAEPSKM